MIERGKEGVHVSVPVKLVACITATLIILVSLVMWGLREGGEKPSPAPAAGGALVPKIESLAVLPLENLSGDPEQEYFADGMTEALIADLGQIRALRVISRTSVMQYKGARKPLPEIARELNVEAVVEGSVMRSGDRVRIRVQLIEAVTDRLLWTQSYERDLRDVLALQSEVARAIAREIQIAVTPEEETRLARTRSVDPEAHELYLRGRYLWNQRTEEGLRKALQYLQQAIQKDPSYALGYAGLADSYNLLPIYAGVPSKEAFPKARAAATKALEIDDTLSEAYTSLAWAKFLYEWDWAGAEREFQRAIALNPSYATTHQWYANLLIALGRADEALTEMERAQDLDPLSLIINNDLGWCLAFSGENERAIRQHKKTLELNQAFPPAHGSLAHAYLQSRRYEEAIASLKKAVALSGGNPKYRAALAHAYAVSGKRGEALRLLEEVKELSTGEPPAYGIAAIYAALGETDQAFDWLEKAYEQRLYRMVFLKVDSRFDVLRGEARFQDLLRRMNFPP